MPEAAGRRQWCTAAPSPNRHTLPWSTSGNAAARRRPGPAQRDDAAAFASRGPGVMSAPPPSEVATDRRPDQLVLAALQLQTFRPDPRGRILGGVTQTARLTMQSQPYEHVEVVLQLWLSTAIEAPASAAAVSGDGHVSSACRGPPASSRREEAGRVKTLGQLALGVAVRRVADCAAATPFCARASHRHTTNRIERSPIALSLVIVGAAATVASAPLHGARPNAQLKKVHCAV